MYTHYFNLNKTAAPISPASLMLMPLSSSSLDGKLVRKLNGLLARSGRAVVTNCLKCPTVWEWFNFNFNVLPSCSLIWTVATGFVSSSFSSSFKIPFNSTCTKSSLKPLQKIVSRERFVTPSHRFYTYPNSIFLSTGNFCHPFSKYFMYHIEWYLAQLAPS